MTDNPSPDDVVEASDPTGVSSSETPEERLSRLGRSLHRSSVLFGFRWGGWSVFLVIALIALAVRTTVFLLFGGDHVVGDEIFYLWFSRGMLAGNYSTAQYMPGWPFLLSLILRLSNQFVALQIFSILLGSLECALTAALTSRLVNAKVGLLAGLTFAFYPEHVFASHRIGAETGLGPILVAITLFVFWSAPRQPTRARLLAGAFLFGVALLFKHFAVLCLAALVFVMVIRFQVPGAERKTVERLGELFLAVFLFLLPLLIYDALVPQKYVAMPLLSAFKSMKEWNLDRVASPPEEQDVETVVKKFGGAAVSAPPSFILHRLDDNLMRLWGMSSHPLRRIGEGGYPPLTRNAGTTLLFEGFYFAILAAGLTGMSFGARSPFRAYAIVCLVLITGMCGVFYMSGRYHLPFMFLFIAFAANLAAEPQAHFDGFRRARLWQKLSWSFLMVATLGCAIRTW